MTKIDLRQGDCLEVMKSIPDGSIDMVLTDPPYGTTACKWDSVIPFEPMWERINKLIKPNGAIVLFSSQPFTSALVMSNPKVFRYEMIWEKERPTNIFFVKKQIAKVHENILIFYKHQPVYNPQMEKSMGVNRRLYDGNESKTHPRQKYKSSNDYNYKIRYPRSVKKINRDRQKNAHPTQKPVALLEYLIKTYTNEGETVLDFTMGSGSTGVACKNTGRNFIGIELDEEYFEIAKKRIEETNQ